MGLACPVEIEFGSPFFLTWMMHHLLSFTAAKIAREENVKHEFTILQIRPMATIESTAKVQFRFDFLHSFFEHFCSMLPTIDAAVMKSGRALGHGNFKGLRDIVYVDPKMFDRRMTKEMAIEVPGLSVTLF